MLIATALLVPVLLGMSAVAVDIGSYADDKRDLQNDADAIALAAGQELCKANSANCSDTSAAAAAANSYASKNNINTSEMTLTYTGLTSTGGVFTSSPTVHVALSRSHDFVFARIFGVNNKDLSVNAGSARVSLGGASGIVPWSVTQATVDSSTSGSLITMKYDATGSNVGNFGAIRIDGAGASVYNASVMYGSTTIACAVSAPNCTTGSCPGTYPNVCSETAPECDGPECTPQTGNLIGPTRTGVDFRMTNTSGACDTFDKVFPMLNGSYQLNPGCNPWIDGPGKCTSAAAICSRRVILIPVVDAFGNGASQPDTIQRFALVFLEGYDSGKCQGNNCEIKGRFVQADVNPGVLAGVYDPISSVHYVKLVE